MALPTTKSPPLYDAAMDTSVGCVVGSPPDCFALTSTLTLAVTVVPSV